MQISSCAAAFRFKCEFIIQPWAMYQPAFCLVVQGGKRVLLGDEVLGEDLDAASAGFRVGYEDPSYFSRDYRKLFGAPPQRDIARLRGNLEPRDSRSGSRTSEAGTFGRSADAS
jgi:hypothetical protein